ncbi:YVTN repeat-like/Quino protein amine dehydrogenase [Polyporus arcularius HHB13444]|uniref:YVTN repeat-like/Quino protein amine dehydrogenase n=1 Tax=Polyporus arcularius HHB13444 TaxID=1314778 RepID=A0A5C3NSP0_9APHY|nr:YVTN repeat-like/Quino protein amine dehydrogenase [Polyporus arcularius HHB13444]
MQYVKSGDITTDIGHAGGVAAVAFSPNGEHLASGGFDRRVCIWNVSDRRLIHTFHGASAALSLAWDPTETGTLICGFEDGSIYAIHASPVRPSSADYLFYTAHHFPVEHLAIHDAQLASGAHEDVAIWERGSDGKVGRWKHQLDLESPPTNSNNDDRGVLVTSIHWTRLRKRQPLLLVTYIYHGYVFFKAGEWTRLRANPLNGLIGSASVTPDGARLIISNVTSGFDIYETETGESVGTLAHPVSGMFAVPVLYVHGGNAVIGGSTCGEVHVWDATALRVHQVLRHAGKTGGYLVSDSLYSHATESDRILALSAHYDVTRDRFLIATGRTDADADMSITIWCAEGGE